MSDPAPARRPLTMRFLVLAVALLLGPGVALAEHEADHRYVIEGYVLDAQRKPMAGVRVAAQGLGSTKTDSAGAYSLSLHLHNEDLGRKLTLRAGAAEHEIRVSFDPDDRHSARVHYANFVGGDFVAGELPGMGLPTWAYVPIVAAAVAAAVALVVVLSRMARRRRRRAAAAAAQAGHQPKRRAKKKRKR